MWLKNSREKYNYHFWETDSIHTKSKSENKTATNIKTTNPEKFKNALTLGGVNGIYEGHL